jgi:dATP pyrophosphohydrolase
MRAPFQILVIPFRHTKTGLEFAVLKRSDAGWWQFIAGGGEDDESPLQAAERETKEEIGISTNQPIRERHCERSEAISSFCNSRLFQLDSMATIPKNNFAAADAWEQDVHVIPEYCFAIEAGDSALALSAEHTELRWVPYNVACNLLKWDSNRNALWELNERLKKKEVEAAAG